MKQVLVFYQRKAVVEPEPYAKGSTTRTFRVVASRLRLLDGTCTCSVLDSGIPELSLAKEKAREYNQRLFPKP